MLSLAQPSFNDPKMGSLIFFFAFFKSWGFNCEKFFMLILEMLSLRPLQERSQFMKSWQNAAIAGTSSAPAKASNDVIKGLVQYTHCSVEGRKWKQQPSWVHYSVQGCKRSAEKGYLTKDTRRILQNLCKNFRVQAIKRACNKGVRWNSSCSAWRALKFKLLSLECAQIQAAQLGVRSNLSCSAWGALKFKLLSLACAQTKDAQHRVRSNSRFSA